MKYPECSGSTTNSFGRNLFDHSSERPVVTLTGPFVTVTVMKLVAGIDSSTQSVKVVLVNAEDGTVVAEASAPHPDGTECHPDRWWDALSAAGRGLLERADAVGVAAQQHGMVTLDEAGAVVRPAMLWNDVKSAPQAAALVTEFGGAREWAARTGSVPTMSFTVTKLRWLAEREPEHAARVHRVLLPHDWLTWRLAGGGPRAAGGDPSAEPATDRGDASGTGYFSPATGDWLPEYATRALGHPVELPRVAAPAQIVGRTPWGAALSAGTGDNMGAALGMGLLEGDVAVSIGTSGTAYAVTGAAVRRPDRAHRRVRRRHRAVPAARRHAERRPGARRHRPDARRRPGRAFRPGAEGGARSGRHRPPPVPGRRADAEPA